MSENLSRLRRRGSFVEFDFTQKNEVMFLWPEVDHEMRFNPGK